MHRGTEAPLLWLLKHLNRNKYKFSTVIPFKYLQNSVGFFQIVRSSVLQTLKIHVWQQYKIYMKRTKFKTQHNKRYHSCSAVFKLHFYSSFWSITSCADYAQTSCWVDEMIYLGVGLNHIVYFCIYSHKGKHHFIYIDLNNTFSLQQYILIRGDVTSLIYLLTWNFFNTSQWSW